MSISDSQLDVAEPASAPAVELPSVASKPAPLPPLPRRRPQPREGLGKQAVPPVIGRQPVLPPPPTALPVPPPGTAEFVPHIPKLSPPEPEPRRKHRGSLFFAMPSWLVSAIVHLIALLVLALITIPPRNTIPPPILLLSGHEIDTEELIVDTTVEIATDLENPSVITLGVESEELTSADFGDSLASLPRPESTVAMASVEATWNDMGALFGDQGSGLKPTDASGQGAEFFGVKAGGRKFVFIVDSSNSMRNGKFGAARKELEYAIRRLDKNQFFYVIFFDHDAARMTFGDGQEPEPRAARAVMQNIQLAEKWMGGIRNELRTDPYEAVKYAVEMLPDAIYILSDGKFTDKGKTERYLAKFNKLNDPIDGPRPKVVIHTVGFYNRDGEETLQRIAKEYGGTYRFVPAPPGFKGKGK